MFAALDLIAEILKPCGKLGPVDRGRELLRLEEAALLESACLQLTRLTVLSLSDIEDYGMRMKLRSGVAVDRACGVLLEGVLRCREVVEDVEGAKFKHRIAEIHAISMKRLSKVEAADDPSDGADDE